jgi:putative aldouronate transport system permease protein
MREAMMKDRTVIMTASGKSMPARARRLFSRQYPLYILMLPAVAATFVFNYIPMYGIQIAFKFYKTRLGIWGSEWVGMKYFIQFIKMPLFGQMLRNTLLISLYQLALFPLDVAVALMVNELRGRAFQKTFQMISYAPHFISTIVICGMIQLMFARGNGVVNNALAALGYARVEFLTHPGAFRSLYVLSGVWQDIGWNTIIYIAALSAVSQDQVEAAHIDGANRMQVIWHVNIPCILPTVIILFILAAGRVLSVGYEKVLPLQNALNLDASRVLSTYVYEIGIRGGQYGLSTAVDLFNCAANLIVLLLVNTLSKSLSEVSLW